MENLRIIIAGAEGNGKKAIVKRLLEHSNSLLNNSLDKSETSTTGGNPSDNSDQLTDEQNVEIWKDIKQVELKTAHRKYTFLIPLNHKEFMIKMVTAAIGTDASIFVVDASKDMVRQSYHYAYLISMLGIKQVIVVVNKMDIKHFNQVSFWALSEQISDFLKELDIRLVGIVPISALYGENIITKSNKMRWSNPPALLELLDLLKTSQNLGRFPLRFLVRAQYITNNKTRISGEVISGKLFNGHQLTFGPVYHTTRVHEIEISDKPNLSAVAGQSVSLILENNAHLEKGHVGFNACQPPVVSDLFTGKVFWFGEEPLNTTDIVEILHLGTRCSAQIEHISETFDPACSGPVCNHAYRLSDSQAASVRIQLDSPLCIDPFDKLPPFGKFAIIKDKKIKGVGIIK